MSSHRMWLPLIILAASTASAGTEDPMDPARVMDFDSFWDYNKPEVTETKFRELVPVAKAGSDVRYYAELLTQVARTQGLQGSFDDAHATLAEVEPLLPEAGETARARFLLERGRALRSSGSPEEARPLFVQALEVAQAAGADQYAVDAAHMLAIVSSGKEALEWNEKAMTMAEASSIPRARQWLGSLYNNIGWTYHDDFKDFDRAHTMFEKALAYREEAGDPGTIRIAKWCVARARRSLGRVDEALAIQRGLEKELATVGEEDGYVFEEIGECLLSLGNTSEATPYFGKAHALLSADTWLVENEGERIERLKELATN